MVFLAVLLIPEVVQQQLPDSTVGAAVVQPAQEGRVCQLEVIVLAGIPLERVYRKTALTPGLIERVFQQASAADGILDLVKVMVGHPILQNVDSPRAKL